MGVTRGWKWAWEALGMSAWIESCTVPLGTVQKITHTHLSAKFKPSAWSHVLLTAQHHPVLHPYPATAWNTGFPGLNASGKKGTQTHCASKVHMQTCNSSDCSGKALQPLRIITFVAVSNTDVPNPAWRDTEHLPQPPLSHGHTHPGTGCGLSPCRISTSSAPQSVL